MWDSLIVILRELLAVYQLLVEKSRQKKEALIHNQVPELETITRAEDELIFKAGRLEAARKEQASLLLNECGMQEGTLADLRQKAEPAIAEQLLEIEAEFAAAITELENLNQLNTRLLEQALSIVNYTINVLAESEAGPNYGEAGQHGTDKAAPAVRRVFDAKV